MFPRSYKSLYDYYHGFSNNITNLIQIACVDEEVLSFLYPSISYPSSSWYV